MVVGASGTGVVELAPLAAHLDEAEEAATHVPAATYTRRRCGRPIYVQLMQAHSGAPRQARGASRHAGLLAIACMLWHCPHAMCLAVALVAVWPIVQETTGIPLRYYYWPFGLLHSTMRSALQRTSGTRHACFNQLTANQPAGTNRQLCTSLRRASGTSQPVFSTHQITVNQ